MSKQNTADQDQPSSNNIKVQVIVELPRLDYCDEAVCPFCSIVNYGEVKCVLFDEPLDNDTNEPCDRCKATKRAQADKAVHCRTCMDALVGRSVNEGEK